MNKTVVLVLAITFVLSACIPISFTGQPTAPVADSQATDAALAGTFAAETLNALPTPTLVLAADTPEPTATDTQPATATEMTTETLAPDPGSTVTQGAPEAAGTEGTITATVTGTAVLTNPAGATATETLYPRFYGTLPPALPFGKIMLVNRAKADVYVSLQCTTIDGYRTIIEYPVNGRLSVSAPAGKFTYVAWVGGRQFQGSFRLSKGEDLAITFNRDKVTLK